jgi:hypothetical protein
MVKWWSRVKGGIEERDWNLFRTQRQMSKIEDGSERRGSRSYNGAKTIPKEEKKQASRRTNKEGELAGIGGMGMVWCGRCGWVREWARSEESARPDPVAGRRSQYQPAEARSRNE